jgi:hypothetical protein
MNSRTTFAAALLALASARGLALAQAPLRPGGISANTRPAVSPYINLVRPGAAPAINYYGIVRPEIAFRNSIGQLQSDVDANRQLITTGRDAGGAVAGGLATGHSAVFLNTGGYFLSSAGGVGAGRGTTPGGQPPASVGVTVGAQGRGGAGAPKGRSR